MQHTSKGCLLPKLRQQFAEFLSNGYLDHLRLLTPPTCVGLRYGPRGLSAEQAFLGTYFSSQANRFNASPVCKRHVGDGILTVCPSTTPFGLALGPPNPQLMSSAAETLGIRWVAISATLRYSCRAFSLLYAPKNLTVLLQRL